MNKVVTTKQAAAILRTSTDTALRFLKSNGVEHDTIGKAYAWQRDDIVALVPAFEDRRTRRKNKPVQSAAGLSAVQQETRRQALGARRHDSHVYYLRPADRPAEFGWRLSALHGKIKMSENETEKYSHWVVLGFFVGGFLCGQVSAAISITVFWLTWLNGSVIEGF